MKKKILVLAIASSLAVPQVALAAEDSLGMQYTSASEGFYGSLRIGVNSNSQRATNGQAGFANGSRVGVAGTADLGGGLESFYTWEIGVGVAQGGGVSTRVGQVGLRGGFGELRAGAFWSNAYNWTYAGSDLATVWSGYNGPGVMQYRTSNTIQYTSPDLNGFQVSGEIQLDSGSASSNDVDLWAVSAKYGIQGFSLGAAYTNQPDGHTVAAVPASSSITPGTSTIETVAAVDAIPGDDRNTLIGKVGYSQDNWFVNGWAATTNDKEANGTTDDTTNYGLAGGVSVDKLNLWVLHDWREVGTAAAGEEDWSFTTFGANYSLGSQTTAFLEYNTVDNSAATNEDDTITIGLVHNF